MSCLNVLVLYVTIVLLNTSGGNNKPPQGVSGVNRHPDQLCTHTCSRSFASDDYCRVRGEADLHNWCREWVMLRSGDVEIVL